MRKNAKNWLAVRATLVVCGAAALYGALPVQAQDGGNIFSDNTTTLTLNDLKRGPGLNWRQVLVSSDSKAGANVQEVNLASDHLIEGDIIRYLGAMPNVYYTQGEVVTLGGESFLQAYRLNYTPEDLNRPFQPPEAKYPPAKMENMSKEQIIKIIDEFLRAKPVNLVLLNLHNVESVVTLRVFDADEQLGLVEKRMGQEFDKGQAERKQAVAEAAHAAEAARKAASAKPKPRSSGAQKPK